MVDLFQQSLIANLHEHFMSIPRYKYQNVMSRMPKTSESQESTKMATPIKSYRVAELRTRKGLRCEAGSSCRGSSRPALARSRR